MVAGNVETCSRVADLVLAAFGRALGQGTMNNLTLGNDDFTYYETLGGGQGACEDADGPSGVHVAMSNTLNTPVEALELEFPLRVVPYAIRRGSGGDGEHRGGDGVIREVEALADMDYSLLTERRRHAPPGAKGGKPGARARTCSTAKSCRRRRAGTLARASDYGSRHREAADMAEKVGFIGLGIMGSLQAMNLAKAGFELTVFNRTREKAEAWADEHGGTVADSPSAVAEASDVVITMVVDGPQVEDMIGQALAGARENTLFIDMSTIAPGDRPRAGERCKAAGHAFVDAPVTGSSPKARTGTLTIMVGGAEDDIERARPLFEIMGEKIVRLRRGRARGRRSR